MARLKELETENTRLKKMYAEERLKAEVLKEAIEKSGKAISLKRDGTTCSANIWIKYSCCLSGVWREPNLPSLPMQGQLSMDIQSRKAQYGIGRHNAHTEKGVGPLNLYF